MSKITLFSIAFSLSTLCGMAQNTQDRTVGDFTGLYASSAVKVMLTQGDVNSVKVEANEKDMPNVKTEVKDGILQVFTSDTKNDVTVFVTAKTLTSIETSGAASIKSVNQFTTTDKLKLQSSGAGSMKLNLKAGDIDANASGASVMNLTGTAQSLTADVSGAANLKAFTLETDKVNISAGGASSVKVFAKQSITAKSSGASSISYKGDPQDKSVEMSGASSIHRSDSDDSNNTSNSTGKDSTKVHIGKNKVIICDDDDCDDHKKHKSSYDYWAGIEIGMNGYLNAQNTMEIPGNNSFLELNNAKSLAFDLNVFEKNIHLYRNNVNLITGLGFEFDHYSFRNPITLDPNSDLVTATSDSLISYDKNKLNTSFINVPLLVMFNTNNEHPSKGFHIGGGVIGGYKIRSVTKQEYNLEGYNYDIKKKDDYNLNPLRLSATVRAGFGGFNLFATYALTTLFEQNKGPQLYPFTVGIAFSGN